MIEKIKAKIQRLFFTRAQQQAFLEDISLLIEDGVPINNAVDTYRSISTGINQEMAANILEKISQGKSIADGMQAWFPNAIVEIVRAGEEGGTLPETMTSASRALSQESYVLSSLLGSIIYPLTVIILACIVAVFVRNSIFVNFSSIKPINLWPANGRLLEHFAGFLQHWWLMIIAILVISGVIISSLLRNLTGEIRKVFDAIPVISLYRYVLAARIMETLGLLLANSVTLKKALVILHQGANPYLSWHLMVMEYRLSGGKENIGEVLDTGLIKEADILRLKVIARSKGFEHALMRLGTQAAMRNAKIVSLTGKITGAVLLGVGAGFAAFMVFAIYDVGTFVGT